MNWLKKYNKYKLKYANIMKKKRDKVGAGTGNLTTIKRPEIQDGGFMDTNSCAPGIIPTEYEDTNGVKKQTCMCEKDYTELAKTLRQNGADKADNINNYSKVKTDHFN